MKPYFLLYSIFISLMMIGSGNVQAQMNPSIKMVSFETFTLPQTLVSLNSQYLNHSMDIVLSDTKFELTIGEIKRVTNTIALTVVIIETKDHYYGEVRIFDLEKNKYIGVVPLDFVHASESVEKVHFAVTEALMGKKYVMAHFDEIKKRAQAKYPAKGHDKVNIANAETTLLTDKFKINPTDLKTEIKNQNALKNLPVNNAKPSEKTEVKIQAANSDNDPKAGSKKNLTLLPAELPTIKKSAENKEVVRAEIAADPEIGSVFSFDAFTFAGQLQIETEKNVKIITTIGHVGFGVRVKQTQVGVDKPWQYTAELQIARPLKKDSYSIPMWRKLELSAMKKNLRPYVSYAAGLEVEPLYFIALPNYGAGLTVIDNNIYWGNFALEFKHPTFGDNYTLTTKFSKSLITSSSTTTKLSGYKVNLTAHAHIDGAYSFDVNFQRSFLSDNGSKASNQILSGFIRYQF